ncbi:hypothetical protein K438DRAFT_2118215 [Mycena galopus ATCC 62051]|nr:hypothetical protein K438DRAFT_2118215 [Mycena galopus ATCC 62051]
MANQMNFVKTQLVAVKEAQSASKLQESLRLSSPLLSSGVTSSHSHLDFPDLDTPMALLSGAEDSITVIHTRGTWARKQQKDEISKSETSDIPARKPAKKKPGPKPKPTTTAKARKKTPGLTSKTRDLHINSDSDVEEVKSPRQRHGSDGAEVVTAIDIVFMIPEAGSEGNPPHADLAYELSSAGQKSAPINLRTSKDWDGLIKSKKDLSIMSMLTVLPDNYMFSLRALLQEGRYASLPSQKFRMFGEDLE